MNSGPFGWWCGPLLLEHSLSWLPVVHLVFYAWPQSIQWKKCRLVCIAAIEADTAANPAAWVKRMKQNLTVNMYICNARPFKSKVFFMLCTNWRKQTLPGVNLFLDSSPAVGEQAHLLCELWQHQVTPVEGAAHLTVPVARLRQLWLHRSQNILFLHQLCFHILHDNITGQVKNYSLFAGLYWLKKYF